jgi:hypothetical protein
MKTKHPRMLCIGKGLLCVGKRMLHFGKRTLGEDKRILGRDKRMSPTTPQLLCKSIRTMFFGEKMKGRLWRVIRSKRNYCKVVVQV